MRNYGGHSHSYEKTTVEVGETHVTIREPSGRIKSAAILDKRADEAGAVQWLLLDRVVHERYGTLQGWEASGCFVTELHVKDASL